MFHKIIMNIKISHPHEKDLSLIFNCKILSFESFIEKHSYLSIHQGKIRGLIIKTDVVKSKKDFSQVFSSVTFSIR